jgi:hypothetical protein
VTALLRMRVNVQLIPASALDTLAVPDPPVVVNLIVPVSWQVTTIGLVAGPMAQLVEWNCSPVGVAGKPMALNWMTYWGNGRGTGVAPAAAGRPAASAEAAMKGRAVKSKRRVAGMGRLPGHESVSIVTPTLTVNVPSIDRAERSLGGACPQTSTEVTAKDKSQLPRSRSTVDATDVMYSYLRFICSPYDCETGFQRLERCVLERRRMRLHPATHTTTPPPKMSRNSAPLILVCFV